MARTTRARKRWTVMVYLAGDNDLDRDGVADLEEMKTVGSTRDVSVVAQFDRSGKKRLTNRYVLRKGTSLDEDVVTALGETNTGDPAVLGDFVTWAVTAHPAERYMLIIWNHGAGWDDANLYEDDAFSSAAPPVVRKGVRITRGDARAPVTMSTARAAFRRGRRALFGPTMSTLLSARAIAFDDQAKDYLDSRELQRVLGHIRRTLKRKIDILGFDACLMSMVEVAYQVRDAAWLTCGSEEEEPNEGWPYGAILKALAAKPAMTPAALAKLIVKKYLASYTAEDGVTLSAVDLSAVEALARAVNGLGRALTAALEDSAARDGVVAVRAQVQEYTAPYDQYCDLADLCALLARRVRSPDVKPACDAVRAALDRTIIAAGLKGRQVAHSHGIAVYFPKRTLSPLYAILDFARKGAWAAFLRDYTDRLSRRR